jgi:hypothetical protein
MNHYYVDIFHFNQQSLPVCEVWGYRSDVAEDFKSYGMLHHVEW